MHDKKAFEFKEIVTIENIESVNELGGNLNEIGEKWGNLSKPVF